MSIEGVEEDKYSGTIVYRLDEVNEKCRICLGFGNIPIFGTKDLSQDVRKYSGIDLSEDDNLPHNMCYHCCKLLESAITFRKLAQKSDLVLRYNPNIPTTSVTDSHIEEKVMKKDEEDSDSEMNPVYLELDDMDDSCDEEQNNSFNDGEEDNADDTINDETQTEASSYTFKVQNKHKEDLMCDLCDEPFKTIAMLNDHFQKNHDDGLTKNCEVCSNIIPNSAYEHHIRIHRESYKKQVEKQNIQCTICRKYVVKSYIKIHTQLHASQKDKTKNTKCKVCHKEITLNYYSDHMRRMHSNLPKAEDKVKSKELEKMLQCPVCDRAIKEHKYKEHVASHNPEAKKLICEECGKEFIYPSVFRTHKLTHGAELKYKCEFCPYRGLHLGLLKIHVRTHTKDYPYKCSMCDMRFITKSNLSVHEQRHTETKTFICPVCNKGFYRSRCLDRHYRTKHLELKNHKCDICGKGFGHQDSLFNHQRRIHNLPSITYKRGRVPTYLKRQQEMQVKGEGQ